MADRYDDRYRGDEWRRDRGFGREFTRDERGPFERTGDEVRSWFGDDEAERRRRMDEARYGRDWDRYGRGDTDRNWDYGHKMGFDYGRGPRNWGTERFGSGAYDYGRTSAARDWNEPAYYRSSYTALGPHTHRATAPAAQDYEMNRPGQGWFAGRGPRGYQRSDDRIREDVCDRLADDPWIDAADIEVAVRAGEVTLSGNVRERSDKRRVEDVIENVSGVREVHNNLHVGTNREATPTTGATTAGTTLHAY